MTTEDLINSAQVYGQPNRGPTVRRPRHTMKTMRRDQDMVARTKVTLALAVDPQPRRAGEEQDPFIMVLIIWFVRRRGLAGRNDPLYPHALSQQQLGDDLLGCPSGKVIEQIDHEWPPGWRGRQRAALRLRTRFDDLAPLRPDLPHRPTSGIM